MAVEGSKSYKSNLYESDDGLVTLKGHTASKKNQRHSETRKLLTSLSHDGESYNQIFNVPSSIGQSSSTIQKGNIFPSTKASPMKSSSIGISKMSASKPPSLSTKHQTKDCCKQSEDDMPLSARLKMLSNHDVQNKPISKFENEQRNFSGSNNKQERPSTLPVKRALDNSNLLHSPAKKSMLTKSKEVGAKGAWLGMVEGSIRESQQELRKKEEELDARQRLIDEQAKERELQIKKTLELLQKRLYLTRELEKKEKQHKERATELESLKKQFEERVVQLESKEKQLEEGVKDLESRKKQFAGRVIELISKEKRYEGQLKELKSKGKEFEGQVKELQSKKKHCEGQAKEFESKEKQLEGRVKELESKEKRFEERVKGLNSKEMQFECRVKYFKSKDNKLEEQVKELQRKVRQFEGQVQELESKERKFEDRVKEHKSKENNFNSKEKQFEEEVKKLEFNEKWFEMQVKNLESREKQFDGQVKEFESKEKFFEDQIRELKLKERQLEVQVKELESKDNKFEGREKELKSKENNFEEQEKELHSKEKRFEEQTRQLEFKEKRYEVQVKELESKERKFGGQVKDLYSKRIQILGQLKELELKGKQYQILIKSFEEEKVPDTKLSLQLLSYVQTNGNELLASSDILVNLKTHSDPAKLVLDAIQNPLIRQCTKEDNAVIVDRWQIFLLEQLMRLSPHIKPYVRDEAMKLALDWKANIIPGTAENSVVVFGFLLLLTIYGLVFNEDEVLKLFEVVAHYKHAVELFRTLGFGDKVSDFVQNLIKKQKHIEAVKFIYAYKLVEKNQSVDLLQEYVQNVRLICERGCKETKSFEIKVKAIDEEIASLESVLLCISDNNIQCQELHMEIQDRILELESQANSSICTGIRDCIQKCNNLV